MKKSELVTPANIKKMPMGQALVELNSAMAEKDMEPVTLNVVGGFALMTRSPILIMSESRYRKISKHFPKLSVKNINCRIVGSIMTSCFLASTLKIFNLQQVNFTLTLLSHSVTFR